MIWANPELLGLLIAVPALALWGYVARRSRRGLPLGTAALLRPLQTPRAKLVPVALWAFRLGAVACLVLALARPQYGRSWVEEKQMGVDIMLALDISGSMRAEDFQPENRLVAAKQVIGTFIDAMANNRLGLVIFAGRSLTLVPLTTDHAMVKAALNRVEFDSVKQDGTAIGDAIGNCLYRLRERNTKGRVIVLFTDGENNSGYLDPIKAAGMARVKDVRVHTIAVGRPGGAPIPFLDAFGQKVYLKDAEGHLILPQINEVTLERIAEITGGRYFRATDTAALKSVYAEIDKLEKTPFETHRHLAYDERYHRFLAGGLLLLLLEVVLGSRRWRVLQAGT